MTPCQQHAPANNARGRVAGEKPELGGRNQDASSLSSATRPPATTSEQCTASTVISRKFNQINSATNGMQVNRKRRLSTNRVSAHLCMQRALLLRHLLLRCRYHTPRRPASSERRRRQAALLPCPPRTTLCTLTAARVMRRNPRRRHACLPRTAHCRRTAARPRRKARKQRRASEARMACCNCPAAHTRRWWYCRVRGRKRLAHLQAQVQQQEHIEVRNHTSTTERVPCVCVWELVCVYSGTATHLCSNKTAANPMLHASAN